VKLDAADPKPRGQPAKASSSHHCGQGRQPAQQNACTAIARCTSSSGSQDSNSAVYSWAGIEVQIFDSFGRRNRGHDCADLPALEDGQGLRSHAELNASKPPVNGSLLILFSAPRLMRPKEIQNAKFESGETQRPAHP